jgi:hypothetical protein
MSGFDYEEYEEYDENIGNSTDNISIVKPESFFSVQEYESEYKRLYTINKDILSKSKIITKTKDIPLELDVEVELDVMRTPTKLNNNEKKRKYETDLSITSMSTSMMSNNLKSNLNYSSSPLCDMGSGDKLINIFNMNRKRHSQDSDYEREGKEDKDSIIEVKESLEKSNKSIKKSINFSSYTQKVDSITTTIFNENTYLKK